jgi:hypothetical protein
MNSPYSKQSTKPPPPDGTVMCSAGKILNIPKPGSVSGAGFGVRAQLFMNIRQHASLRIRQELAWRFPEIADILPTSLRCNHWQSQTKAGKP